jgi:hypothetical protein
MAQIDNLDTTLHRLEDEANWSQRKKGRFIRWLTERDYIKPGQRPGSRTVEDLFSKIEAFEEQYQEDDNGQDSPLAPSR